MEYSKKELELLSEAWDTMAACNLSGVVHAFSRAMTSLSRIAFENNLGTEWKNQHIVSKLYADKIIELTQGLSRTELEELAKL